MKTQVSHAEALKQELMERYGLREDQVRLGLTIYTTDLELGNTVLSDFTKDKELYHLDRLKEGMNCNSVFGHNMNVYVHVKDGFYAPYLYDEEGEDNE
jgi:hypothetical protein